MGLKDLFVARGNVLDNIAEFSSRTYAEPNSILRNLGKMTFADVTAQAGPDMQVPLRIAVVPSAICSMTDNGHRGYRIEWKGQNPAQCDREFQTSG